ncbi:MAG TPA: glycosyltransferase family 4 protein [Pyrinomonadaceae bacterium]|nr:glycosyltransferase family 4 protein [Pyrinomonadaceae bacterium]
MSRIAIVTSHLTSAAAVSTDALMMQRVLEKRGCEARLYAGSTDFEDGKIWPIEEIGEFLINPDDILIYHHSIGWDLGMALLSEMHCRTIIKYHNVTPSQFFAGVSTWHETACAEGEQQLEMIVDARYEKYLSDSEYNMKQLLALGADPASCFVVPPFHQIDRLSAIQGDLETLESYRDDKTNIVSVSRVIPNKNQEGLIEAFANYHHYYNSKSRLLIVGREEKAFETYSTRLRELIKFLDLNGAVVFSGEVSDAALKALYLLSKVFLFASKHEGFSVPLVEAMALKVPIVSYGVTAVPETVGGAGIVVDNLDLEEMASAIDLIVRDEAANVALGLRGWERYKQNFTNEKIEFLFLHALGGRC